MYYRTIELQSFTLMTTYIQTQKLQAVNKQINEIFQTSSKKKIKQKLRK